MNDANEQRHVVNKTYDEIRVGDLRAGLRLREVPVRMYAPRPGRSMHPGWIKLYYVFKQLVSLGMVVLATGIRRRGDGSAWTGVAPTARSWASESSGARASSSRRS